MTQPSMDKASIIEFSNTVRDRLYEETKNRAANYGIFPDKIQDVDKEFEDSIVIGGRVFNRKIKRQREQLVREVREKGYDQLIDEVTYTWFNRFVALKFMEVNGYLPGNVKVFSSNEVGKTEPDILSKSLKLDFLNIDRNAVIDLKSAGKDEELYKYLTLSLCNYLNKIMPFLFENIEDHTELLFPDKLLHTDSILRDINSLIKEEDWKEVEVIGWIYQDYINPRKTKVFADLKKNIKISKENIPAATQLFTPKWIVKYLVENSVGRLWLESNPNKDLQAKFRYFIEQNTTNNNNNENNELKRTETNSGGVSSYGVRTSSLLISSYKNVEGAEKEIQSKSIPMKKILSPEEISVLDPAKGSGHILVYTFEVLYEIYRSQGYLESEIAPLILNKNLYGLEIDDRAAQLAGFALMMKARMYDKELFNKKISLNICAIQETREDCTLNRGKYPELCRLWDFFIDAKNYGSILKVEGFDFEKLSCEVELLKNEETLESFFAWSKLDELVKQARLMSRKYDCVVTNPPYMGSGNMNSKLSQFVKKEYPDSNGDLFAVFIEKCLDMTKIKGYSSLITQQTWMFISSYENLRNKILNNYFINNLIQIGFNSFPELNSKLALACAFIIKNENNLLLKGTYLNLNDVSKTADKEKVFLDKLQKNEIFRVNSYYFKTIKGQPIAYWMSDKVRKVFETSQSLGSIADTRLGMATGDNNKFLRSWNEVQFDKIGFYYSNREIAKGSNNKWFPYNKGGDYRKWYGNNEFVVNWENDGREIRNFKDASGKVRSHNYNLDYIFKKGISWSFVSWVFGVRASFEGFIFDVGGSSLFPLKKDYYYILGYLCSKTASKNLEIINPSLNYQVGNIGTLPIIFPKTEEIKLTIEQLSKDCIFISKEEWDSRETSWDFKTNELLRHKTSDKIKDAYNNYCAYWKDKIFKLHANEEELNRIFINIYELADEITPDVPLNEVSILKDESEIKGGELVFKKEVIVKQFISYAIGCMFGRYSPDKEGLILANKGETIKDFLAKVPAPSFMPDDDNIIPVLEDEYFKDDIVSRFKEFLKITLGAESLADNLDFIAGALSKSKKGSESSEKIIRDYFLKSFFKDHARTYQKRPIYWPFTSGKGRGFNALVYMHRYDKTLLAKMRTDYLLELEAKLDARMGMLGDSARDKQEKDRLGTLMQELAAYDEKLNNKALAFVDIDLDDGVTANYAKFEGLVEGI